jgi:hypothetical protein
VIICHVQYTFGLFQLNIEINTYIVYFSRSIDAYPLCSLLRCQLYAQALSWVDFSFKESQSLPHVWTINWFLINYEADQTRGPYSDKCRRTEQKALLQKKYFVRIVILLLFLKGKKQGYEITALSVCCPILTFMQVDRFSQKFYLLLFYWRVRKLRNF